MDGSVPVRRLEYTLKSCRVVASLRRELSVPFNWLMLTEITLREHSTCP